MKKEYEAPKAEKFAFDFTENVTASSVSYATTDDSNDYWECHTRYADAEYVCGYDGRDLSNPFWECKTNG